MRTLKSFAEEMEANLVRTIRELVEAENLHEKWSGTPETHPLHKTLLSHGYNHTRTHTQDGITHEYDNPKTGHFAQIWGNSNLETKT